MKLEAPGRSGILIVHLWIESRGRDGLRARITRTLDAAGNDRETATAGTPEDIYSMVRTWVEDFSATN